MKTKLYFDNDGNDEVQIEIPYKDMDELVKNICRLIVEGKKSENDNFMFSIKGRLVNIVRKSSFNGVYTI